VYLDRRNFLLTTASAALAADKPAPRPNILLILTDNLGSWMLGCYGNKEIRTPNIDTLARTGIRFVNSFAGSPVSVPSRATLLTGLTPRQHGIYEGRSETAIDKVLANQGYTCAKISNDQQKSASGFLDQQNSNKPFFLTVEYLNEGTSEHPQKYYEMYANTKFDTIGWERPAANAARDKELLNDPVGSLRKAAASITALDDQIPGLLRKLQDRGLRDNTLVIFTSANGYLLGRHGLWSDGLASDPLNMYEEVIGVPAIWSWPGKIPAEAMTPELVSSYDLVPSLIELTGASVSSGKALCGRNYVPLATRQRLPKKQPWKNIVYAEYQNNAMARDTRFKLILRNDGKGPNELFDLSTDVHEKTNRYDDTRFVTVRDRLAKELAAWRQRTAS
jgi:arylsulfatase A-like enzyme